MNALLLLVATAAADPAPSLVRCSTLLSGPDGRGEVWGVGADDADATAQAERLAWTVAGLQQTRWLWADVLGWQDARIAQRFDSWKPELPVDGVALAPGSCEPIEVHDTGLPRAWVATTNEGSAVRADAVVAARAVRRETCFSAWNDAWVEALWKATAASGRSRPRALLDGSDSATKGLLSCLASKPQVSRQGAMPLQAAYRDGDFRCTGASLGGTPLMVGRGPSLEAATEDARQQGQALELRVAAARGLTAMVARPEARGELFAAALSVGRPPPVDLSCVVVSAAAQPTWSGGGDGQLCRPAEQSLPEGPGSLDDRCWAAQAPLFEQARAQKPALATGEYAKVAADGWAQAWACHVDCVNRARAVETVVPVVVARQLAGVE